MSLAANTLYYGDCLEWLPQFPSESVDLIYLDPPFNSNQDYNLLFGNDQQPSNEQASAQVRAFTDTWRWDTAAAERVERLSRAASHPVHKAIVGLRTMIGEGGMLAYLSYMGERLAEMPRVLKPTGSIYLHCDPTASHGLKLVMDATFGPLNFRSEVIWRRSSGHNSVTRQYGPIHDTILFYAKRSTAYFEPGFTPPTAGYVREWFTGEDERGRFRTNMLTGPGITREGSSGKPWRHFDPTTVGRHWAIPRTLRAMLPPESADWTTQQSLDHLYDLGYIYIPRQGRGQPKYKQYVGRGAPYQDVWAYQPYTHGCLHGTDAAIDGDVSWIQNDSERLGYPTQKPEGLLARIIESSCPEKGIVLDPFCGCGTHEVPPVAVPLPMLDPEPSVVPGVGAS